MSGVGGSLRAGDEVVGVLVLEGDNEDVLTTLLAVNLDVRGSAAFNDNIRLVGDRLRRDRSSNVLGRGDCTKC